MELNLSWRASSCSNTQKKLSAFYGGRMFIIMFTSSSHWFLSWARLIQSTLSHPIFLRSILILPSKICLGRHVGLIHSGFHIRLRINFSPMHATSPVHLTILDLIILMIFVEGYILWRSSLCRFLQQLTTSQTLFFHTVFSVPCFRHPQSVISLNVRDEVSRLYKSTGRITFLYP
jgi:hypothetical protein